MTRPSRRRLTITQGRLYSLVIVLVGAALLLPSLTKWRPAASLRPLSGVTFARRPAPPAPTSTGPTTTTTALAPTGTAAPALAPVPSLPATSPSAPAGTPASVLTIPPLSASGSTSGVTSEPTCKAAALDAEATRTLDELNASLKVLPTSTMETVLGLVTGCNDANPALLAVGALSEFGDDLSILFDEVPGARSLKLPSVHALTLPSDVLPVLGALKPVFGPVCAEINSASDIVILIAPHYPQVIDGAASVALFQAAATCGELTGAG